MEPESSGAGLKGVQQGRLQSKAVSLVRNEGQGWGPEIQEKNGGRSG